ncbi:hypothetical protein CJD36_008560 [Flavipsychrobacter stenotrophus]|uniref:Type II toxin-antitoxin system RelE/ParE family toxin n=1 Tax=Flavipsychrobacter stenotrophus TaxID=2077091 RepID=A0A2S7SZ94_9BACT|nr:type II toxin-antitoxin system RelE/ParE family toxin [Flavipsychrobacter stenotrophus]PQJ11836.1 hypothetical protein CJD36_008560 [Flavipsychrobacter stenotrophus]
MAHQVVIKKQFANDLHKVLTYLETEWSKPVAEQFFVKINNSLRALSSHPFTGAPSVKIKNARSIFVTEHNRLFYKVEGNRIYVLRLLDTRQKRY